MKPVPNSKVGNAQRGDVEARYDNRGLLDEVVADRAYVHLERMNDNMFSLIVETRKGRCCYTLGLRRAPIDGVELFREAAPKRKAIRKR